MAIQQAFLAARQADEIQDCIFFLEHEPVITLGRRARKEYLLLPKKKLEALGYPVYVSSRGGDVTLHAPGQVVMYPILYLPDLALGAKGYLTILEQIAVETAKHFGVEAFMREGKAGAWTSEGKIAAIGFKCSRWVTHHGLSFNVNLDLQAFSYIVGCGLEGEAVSSMASILGEDLCPSISQVFSAMKQEVQAILKRELAEQDLSLLPESLQGVIVDYI